MAPWDDSDHVWVLVAAKLLPTHRSHCEGIAGYTLWNSVAEKMRFGIQTALSLPVLLLCSLIWVVDL